MVLKKNSSNQPEHCLFCVGSFMKLAGSLKIFELTRTYNLRFFDSILFFQRIENGLFSDSEILKKPKPRVL
jgi:hypothetical protein